MLPLSNDGPM
jgi:hypothetical protein